MSFFSGTRHSEYVKPTIFFSLLEPIIGVIFICCWIFFVLFANDDEGLFVLRNNAVSPINVGIEDFLKEHKTLNVNMNITDSASTSMNNKINFDR